MAKHFIIIHEKILDISKSTDNSQISECFTKYTQTNVTLLFAVVCPSTTLEVTFSNMHQFK
jgi:hypothetical protein